MPPPFHNGAFSFYPFTTYQFAEEKGEENLTQGPPTKIPSVIKDLFGGRRPATPRDKSDKHMKKPRKAATFFVFQNWLFNIADLEEQKRKRSRCHVPLERFLV